MKLYFSPILIAALLAAPISMPVYAFQQQPAQQATQQKQDSGAARGSPKARDGAERDADGVERVYDRDHRDYHRWDNAEDQAYRSFWQEHHRAYRAYSLLNRREQGHYWKWRHERSDASGPSSGSATQ
jgi:Ni/Co efflux regulator RcnB